MSTVLLGAWYCWGLFAAFSAQLPSPVCRGYHFFAVDGSDVQVPLEGSHDEYSYFRNGRQRDYFQLHLSAVYDLSLPREDEYDFSFDRRKRGLINYKNVFSKVVARCIMSQVINQN